MNKDIAVLLCTYNGEKYLCTQLDSILKQKDVNVTLFVRDDGSSDETCNILNRYKTQYPDKVILVENVNKNLGPGLGFMKLFFKVFKEYKRFSFYAFADQDDIWLDNKLYEGIKKIGD
ncbi:MAG: glycosyltransferase, partial [Lachnospiraceae bacterium]|nr:glycosyltransferase [Lachnospiraceae bacterium]